MENNFTPNMKKSCSIHMSIVKYRVTDTYGISKILVSPCPNNFSLREDNTLRDSRNLEYPIKFLTLEEAIDTVYEIIKSNQVRIDLYNDVYIEDIVEINIRQMYDNNGYISCRTVMSVEMTVLDFAKIKIGDNND